MNELSTNMNYFGIDLPPFNKHYFKKLQLVKSSLAFQKGLNERKLIWLKQFLVTAIRSIALSDDPIDIYGFVETLFKSEFFHLLHVDDLVSLNTSLRIIKLPGQVDLKPLINRVEQLV